MDTSDVGALVLSIFQGVEQPVPTPGVDSPQVPVGPHTFGRLVVGGSLGVQGITEVRPHATTATNGVGVPWRAEVIWWQVHPRGKHTSRHDRASTSWCAPWSRGSSTSSGVL